MIGLRGFIKLFFIVCTLLLFKNQGLFGNDLKKTPIGHYGAILERSATHIKGAITEKIVLYPHKGILGGDNLERNGTLVRYPGAQATIIQAHGVTCCEADIALFRLLFPRGKFNILSFDFRAHGEKSCGQYCTLGSDEANDVTAAAKFVKNHPDLKGLPIFAYAFSMGAVATIVAQAREGNLFDALVLDCPFDSAENVIKRGLDNLKCTILGRTFAMPGKSLLQKYAFHPYVQAALRSLLKVVANMDSKDIALRVFPIEPVKIVQKIKVPVFYICCKNDDKVSIDGIKSIFQNTASPYKILWLTKGRRHFDSCFTLPEQYSDAIVDFYEKALAGKLKQPHQEIIEDTHDFSTHGG